MTTPGDRRTKGQRTRDELVAAARRRFGAAPYGEVTVSAVARDVGITPAASYAYFADKTALFRAAVDDELTAWVDAGMPAATGERPMLALLVHLVGALDDHPLIARVLREGESEPLVHVLGSEAVRRLRTEIAGTIELRQREGSTPTGAAPDTLAIGIETIVVALLAFSVRADVFADHERVDGVVTLLQSALGRPDGSLPDFASSARPTDD